MNAEQYVDFLDRIAMNPRPCKYGHFDCSDTNGGPCSDEEFSELSPSDRAKVRDETGMLDDPLEPEL